MRKAVVVVAVLFFVVAVGTAFAASSSSAKTDTHKTKEKPKKPEHAKPVTSKVTGTEIGNARVTYVEPDHSGVTVTQDGKLIHVRAMGKGAAKQQMMDEIGKMQPGSTITGTGELKGDRFYLTEMAAGGAATEKPSHVKKEHAKKEPKPKKEHPKKGSK